jgi:cytochrome P450
MGIRVVPPRPPTREALPITHGSLLDFPRDPITCMRRLYQAHGTVAALEEDGHRLYFAFGPEYNQQVLSDPQTFHARFFALRGPRHSAQRRLTATLLSMNGDEHKRHRRLIMGPFQKKSIERYRDRLAFLAEEMVAGWQPGQVRDIFQDMKQYMLRVTSSILFGYDQPELAYEIGGRTERWVAMNHELGIGAFLAEASVSCCYDKLLAAAAGLEESVRAMIDLRRSSRMLGDDVLSLLIRAHDETGTGLSDAELIGQSAILFAAAHLTSTNTLTWTLFLLAQHPDVAAELAAECERVLAGATPTLAQLDTLSVLDRVLKESMRMLPASAYSQRVTSVGAELGPFSLPPGSVVIFSQFMTHHLAEIFADPERFCPDRWLAMTPSPYAFLPFAAGPRMCIGAPLALTIFKITLPVILQRCHLSVVPGASINGKVISTMLTPVSGMPMRVEPPGGPFQSHPVGGNIWELVSL